jgi:hypothetical protein
MPWSLPPCTCPRDDSGDTRGCERHDSRSDYNQATQFYAEAVPCESCGEPCDSRTWNAEYDLWIGAACSCTIPDQPVCPDLVPLIMAVTHVRELVEVCKEHRKSCTKCGEPVELPVRKMAEPERRQKREAA